ncbi:lipopolysaccharide export system protein LptC [Acinetobacter calcoaceticus]|uniref:Lipopolysaccharide export system protein LptC n=1 Tax=Acinetobacter calcoaceticus TaxID=471 RepID=A0A4R1XMV0_ACICA|nr:lipopolysaccharide export system protein LptC [Acinetobacter calcoaceticus]
MDTRVLYMTAVVVATVSGGYYYYSGKEKKLDADSSLSTVFTADKIQMLQTDEQGNLYMRAQVDHLEQDVLAKTTKLTNLEASMYKADQVDATFFANEARGFNDNEKVVLTGAVRANKLGQQGNLTFLTEELTGYPELGTLETQHPVQVTAPNGQFVSQGLKADLNQGQYEFFSIRGKYASQ